MPNFANHPRRRAIITTMIAGATALTLITSCSATSAGTAAAVSTAAANSTGLFDSSAVHSLSIDYDQAEYQAMIDTFVATGDKEWISATVTIDGTVFENVGIKLKGNSTLQGLRSGEGGEGNFGQQGDTSTTADQTTSADATTADPTTAAGTTIPDDSVVDPTPQQDADAAPQDQGGRMQGGGPGGDVSADEPAGLPWRIRLDKFVEGQNYDGETDIVVRGGNTETSLNEAVALELIGAAGLATEEATSTRFSVNGSDEVLRLVIENPDEDWDETNFGSDGILYKAEAGGDYSYRGEDASAYAEAFSVEASTTGEDDYTPLIALLKFLNESDDATFAAELGNHIDVQSFADYLAIQDLVANSDDIDGPGNNSYLRYDSSTGLFTVVAWDQNLSFSAMGGGGGQADFGQRPQRGGMPDGAMPDRTAPDGAAGGGQSAGPGGMGGRGSNVLAERFKANTEFNALYEKAVTDLRAQLFASGEAQAILDTWTSVLKAQAPDLVSEETITSEAASISEQFTAS